VTLLVLAGWLTYEAIGRLLDPPHVTGMSVLITALVGVVVNGAATWMISRAGRSSLNVEGGFQHILNELFAFLATAANPRRLCLQVSSALVH
jgi:cobalt-zinc-cadmium efflux system protein